MTRGGRCRNTPYGLSRHTLFYCSRATLSTRRYSRKREVRTMKSILSLALLVGLGLSASAVQAWDTSPSCGASTFPATGQTSSFPPTFKTTDAPVRDDGVVRAGGALRYRNNGDGTITDLNTGLMWEQKIRDIVTSQGNHDVTKTFPWDSAASSIWDWLEQ